MPEFIVTYHGGNKPESSEAGKEGMEKWMAWAAGLGAALVNPGSPVGITQVLTSKGVSEERPPNPLMGYSVIEASDLDTALELLKDCPHLHIFEGTLEVSEIKQMPEM